MVRTGRSRKLKTTVESLQDVDEEKLRTLWCGSESGSLDPRVDEEILFELFQNAGPLERVIICSARNQTGKKFALIVFQHLESPAYAAELFKGTELFEKALLLSTNSRIATGLSKILIYPLLESYEGGIEIG